MTSPIRPVSDEHRHEPANYELEPNELAAAKAHAFARRSQHDRSDDADHYWQHLGAETQALELEAMRAALTQAHRSCCADERERCAKIAEDAHLAGGLEWTPRAIATAIRSNSHDQ